MGEWVEGWQSGFEAGYSAGVKLRGTSLRDPEYAMKEGDTGSILYQKTGIKRKQSKKQKILNEMAGVKWRKYKKGSGKKTYFDIRAEVTRSAIYKKKVKNL